MDYPNVRHPDCPDVHLGLCPKCRRLYDRDAKAAQKASEAVSAGSVSVSSDVIDMAPEEPSVRVDDGPEVGVSVERGKEVDASPLTNAQRQKRWRNKDPDGYRKWNRERMRRRRQQS